MRDAFIIGTATSRFQAYGPGSGVRIATDVALKAMADAGITFADVDLVVGGTAHPLSPRPIFVARELGLTGAPIVHVSNASATGLTAVHEAINAVREKRADVVLAIGYDAGDSDTTTEAVISNEVAFPPVVSYALIARDRMNRYGTTPEHFAMVAAKNWNYARHNIFAARQASEEVTVDSILAARMVAVPLTSMMATPWCEGAAAVVLSSSPHAIKPTVRVAASVTASRQYIVGEPLEGPIGGPLGLAASTARRMFKDAGIGPGEVDVAQVHDAFSCEEIEYYEALGFVGPGEADDLLSQGAFGPDSRKKFGLAEFSTGGGLLARGHPGGPTGIAQVHETFYRLTNTSDKTGLCQLLGAGGICVSQVLTRE